MVRIFNTFNTQHAFGPESPPAAVDQILIIHDNICSKVKQCFLVLVCVYNQFALP